MAIMHALEHVHHPREPTVVLNTDSRKRLQALLAIPRTTQASLPQSWASSKASQRNAGRCNATGYPVTRECEETITLTRSFMRALPPQSLCVQACNRLRHRPSAQQHTTPIRNSRNWRGQRNRWPVMLQPRPTSNWKPLTSSAEQTKRCYRASDWAIVQGRSCCKMV